MGRAIVTGPRFLQRPGVPAVPRPAVAAAPADVPGYFDTYRDRLFKYIPGEIVTLYFGLREGLERSHHVPHALQWVAFAFCLAATPVYLWRVQHVAAWRQLLISTVSFAVWAFALGEPFADLRWYQPVYGALLLPVFTFFVAAIRPDPNSDPQPQGH